MGSTCHVSVTCPDPTLGRELERLARLRIGLLEGCWTRFRPESDLMRLNQSAGCGWQRVGEDLLTLVVRMRLGWQVTAGHFDPTVLPAVRAAGYDRDWQDVVRRAPFTDPEEGLVSVPGMADVLVDPTAAAVLLPAGVQLDAGAIGKGLAADLVVEELLDAGATSALVNIGGDVAMGGDRAGEWQIGVVDERTPGEDRDRLWQVWDLPRGARVGVATSTSLKRRWGTGPHVRHHVIDPATGMSQQGPVLQATVVAGEAWLAEVWATAALMGTVQGAVALLRESSLSGAVFTNDEVVTVGVAPLVDVGGLRG